jgi:hypothetical protein
MPMTFDGSGTITGLAAGGLPNSSVITADIADAAITAAKLDGAQSGSAPIYGARAWVNFNGTGTVAITASGNVSSITDNGTGDYTLNFTTAMPDGNYSFAGSGGNATGSLPLYALMPYSNAILAGSCRFHVNYVSGTAEDPIFVAALIIR